MYDPQESSDGYRVLVDRLWPRGIKKVTGYSATGISRLCPAAAHCADENH
ncbi:DUF488 family protein, partial [Klebsiella pneumoniae]